MKMVSVRFVVVAVLAVLAGSINIPIAVDASVLREKGRTFIVDQSGERWEVTQAVSLGFDPEKFQYGIGRNAITPLDDSLIRKGDGRLPEWTRVIGVKGGSSPRAYSVTALLSHEIVNSNLEGKPVAVGY